MNAPKMTKESCAEQGRKVAQQKFSEGARPGDYRGKGLMTICPFRAGFWQHKAWTEAYEAEMNRLAESTVLQSARAHAARTAPQRIAETTRRAFGFAVSVRGPLYPSRTKGRTKRGWTEARA